MIYTTRIIKAREFADHAHAGQARKYTDEPYITHPIAVVKILASVCIDEDMLVAAYLHDTVEDTDVTLEMIQKRFGDRVASLVNDLTDVSTPEDGSRKVRKAKDLIHTSLAHPDAKTIKLADLIHNTSSLLKHDPEFAKVYMAEKRALLHALREGNGTLYHEACQIVDAYYSREVS
jgi:guanosine-3',5'-bis(diphosphate) 3'-pyrophosphohydrolase